MHIENRDDYEYFITESGVLTAQHSIPQTAK
jgi:hypothetical protein